MNKRLVSLLLTVPFAVGVAGVGSVAAAPLTKLCPNCPPGPSMVINRAEITVLTQAAEVPSATLNKVASGGFGGTTFVRKVPVTQKLAPQGGYHRYLFSVGNLTTDQRYSLSATAGVTQGAVQFTLTNAQRVVTKSVQLTPLR